MSRRIGLVLWLLAAGCLYFFENNTGTRIVLIASALLPLVPSVRRFLFRADAEERAARDSVGVRSFSYPEEEEAGDVRAYQAGDPVSRIHWKLSAKRDELMVRPLEQDLPVEETRRAAAPEEPERRRKRYLLPCMFLLAAALLLLIPEVRLSVRALCNRLFAASEAVNAYVYQRFAVPEGQTVLWAALVLALLLAALLSTILITRSRILMMALLIGAAAFQVYFGLAFPGWANVSLFILAALFCAGRPWERRGALTLLIGVLIVAAVVLLVFPGPDAGTEAASERVRDSLGRMAEQITGVSPELPAGENETRHVHSRTLAEGGDEARAEREYRLVTVEEEQISMPHWVDWLRIALLLLLTVAVLILPFLPFLWLNARQKRAREARAAFTSPSVSEAVCAIFRQVIAWLEAMGLGADDRLYRDWPSRLASELPPDYVRLFAPCAALFEEAAYSDHPLEEDCREQCLRLFSETETVLLRRADWRQKLRLKYKECLWIESE